MGGPSVLVWVVDVPAGHRDAEWAQGVLDADRACVCVEHVGEALVHSGASSAPPPTSTIRCSRRRAWTAGQSTLPGLSCSSTHTFISRESGCSGQTPHLGAGLLALMPSMSSVTS